MTTNNCSNIAVDIACIVTRREALVGEGETGEHDYDRRIRREENWVSPYHEKARRNCRGGSCVRLHIK